jgi:hypothetical protein
MSNEQGFKEILGDTWREYFSKEEAIKDLLKTVDMKDYVLKNIVTRYAIDDDQLAITSILKNTNTSRLEKIIIDVKTGFPTWEQMMDVVYNMGSDCDTKVVIVDGANNPNDYANFMNIGFGFSTILSDSNVKIYILVAQASGENGKPLEYEVIYEPSTLSSWPYPDIPPKCKFEQAEFWTLYFCDILGYEFPSSQDPEYWLDYQYCDHDGGFSFCPEWTDKGLFVHATAQCDRTIEEIGSLRKNRFGEIREHYKGSTVSIQKKKGVPYRISLKVSDTPFRDVILSTPDEKSDYADTVHDSLREFRKYIMWLIDGTEEDEHVPLVWNM